MLAIITGASRGIGKSLANIFASHKYNLLLTCENNLDLLSKQKNYLEKTYNVRVKIVKGLITPQDVYEDVYILINNAGKCDYNLFSDITYEKYKEIIFSNLDYTFLTSKIVLPYLIKNKQGIIVNISSIWGIVGASLETIYSMTKGGINAFTKSLAKELIESGIDVIAFALGAVDTDMNSHLDDNDKKDFINSLTNKKMFTSDEISNIIYQCILNKKYNSGDIIEINNGLI